jgi:hypothetical protein
MCQSVGSRPPAHITWWLDDRRLESAKETVSEAKGPFSMTSYYTITTTTNKGWCRCHQGFEGVKCLVARTQILFSPTLFHITMKT